MQREDTSKAIIEKALELFAERGYDAVSVGDIAASVGIKAPSLYNHYSSKQAIFDAIVKDVCLDYERGTGKMNVHVQSAGSDVESLKKITADDLKEKLRGVFLFSLRDRKVALFRKMLTIEQFRSPELAALYSERYVDRLVAYHADIFRALIAVGEIAEEDPVALAYEYVSPVVVLLGMCDRQPERENECLSLLDKHVGLFFRAYNIRKDE